jgi:hypothetical protein
MSIGKTYLKFLRRSIFSSPDDIQRPYHKIANFVVKIISLAFLVVGLWLNLLAMNVYITNVAGIREFGTMGLIEKAASLDQIIALSLFGISFILAGIFLGLVLLLRYTAFTLPDRIFLRFNKKGGLQSFDTQNK